MKIRYPMLLTALLASCSLACRAPEAGPPPEESVQIPNPVVEVANAEAFLPLSLSIDAPEGAENLRYSIISNEIAQVNFSLDGRSYTYRAAHSTEDISGVYETFDEPALNIEADGMDCYASVTVRTIQGGKKGALAAWRYGETQYTFYTGDAVSGEDIGNLALRLAEKVCPPPEMDAAASAALADVFELRAAADEDLLSALYGYFRGVLYENDWFDARAAKGIKICVYAARAYGAGTLAVADFYLGGELAPDLYYIEDGRVISGTRGSDCWAINYTRLNGDTVVYGKSFAWDGAPLATTHAVATFSDGSSQSVELPATAGGAQPGYLFIHESEVWLDTLTLYDGEKVVADQDCGEFTMSEIAGRFAPDAPLCQWTRFSPMLDDAARDRAFMDAASSTIAVVLVGDEAAGLRKWYKDSGLALADLWRTVNNGLPVRVQSDTPLLLDGIAREDAEALYWVELAADDGTEAGIQSALRQAGAGLDSRAAGGGDGSDVIWSTPGAPGHYGLYVLVLDYGDCFYTALFDVQRREA